VSALLLDDALQKCVDTEIVSFSVDALNALIFSGGSVATYLRCVVIFSDSTIIIYLLILIVKKFENRPSYMHEAYKILPMFGPPCVWWSGALTTKALI